MIETATARVLIGLACFAGVAAASRGQVSMPAAPATSMPSPPPSLAYPEVSVWHGWLAEHLAGDIEAAIDIFERARRESAPGADRLALSLRLIEVRRLRADDAGADRLLQELARELGRAVDGDRLRERLPPAPGELLQALRDGDPARLAAARSRFLRQMDSDGLAALPLRFGGGTRRGGEPLAVREAPPHAAEPAPPALRFKLPLPQPRSRDSILRRRATELAELRLDGEVAAAVRLEADLVERLRASGATAWLVPEQELALPEPAAWSGLVDDAIARLRQAAGAAARGQREVAALLRAQARLDGLRGAGRLDEAARCALLDLPWRWRD